MSAFWAIYEATVRMGERAKERVEEHELTYLYARAISHERVTYSPSHPPLCNHTIVITRLLRRVQMFSCTILFSRTPSIYALSRERWR
jgi:hypothetical protein